LNRFSDGLSTTGQKLAEERGFWKGREGFGGYALTLYLTCWAITESWVNHACNHSFVAQ